MSASDTDLPVQQTIPISQFGQFGEFKMDLKNNSYDNDLYFLFQPLTHVSIDEKTRTGETLLLHSTYFRSKLGPDQR